MNEHEMLKDRFRDRVFAAKERTTKVAIETAYADMSRRQDGHTVALKDACIDWLEDQVFTKPLHITDFDTWHKKQCSDLVAKWNKVKNGFGTIGKAQKVINMTFKYLSCITSDYDHLLPYCHMTLDSYTLAWYKTAVQPWVKTKGWQDVDKPEAWSRICSNDEYMIIQKNIREFLREGAEYSIEIGSKTTATLKLPTIPIEAEFVIWEAQIIKERYTNLIKELNNYIEPHRGIPAGKDNDAWLLGDLFSNFLQDYCKII